MTHLGESGTAGANERHADDRPASARVLDAVAAAEGVRPWEVDARLYDVVDPDALDDLFGDAETGTTLTFPFCGYVVTVHEGGEIELSGVDG